MGVKRSDARNCNQMVLEAVCKMNEIIVDSRFGEEAFSGTSPPLTLSQDSNEQPHHQRFNLNVPTIAELRNKVSFLESDIHERYSIHIRHGSSNAVLEKWEIHFVVPAEPNAVKEDSSRAFLLKTYVQLMVFLRSCCSLCLLLPVSKLSSNLLSYEVVRPAAKQDQKLNGLESLLDYKLHEFKPIHALTGSLHVSVGYISDYSTLLPPSPPPAPLHSREAAEKEDSDFVFAHSPPKDESKMSDQESTKPKSALTKMLLEHSRQATGQDADVSTSPPPEEGHLQPSEVSEVLNQFKDVDISTSSKDGEPALGSRATSHPRAIPIRKKDHSIVYKKTRSTPMRESGGNVDTSEFLLDDVSQFYAFPSELTRPRSLPVDADLGQGQSSSLHAGYAQCLSQSKIARSVFEVERSHRPGSLPLPHPLRSRATESFPFKRPRRSSKSFNMYEPGMRQSSSILSDKSIKMVTLPSGTIYRSPSGSSLADLVSRSSLTSQQLGFATSSLDPTTPPFVVFAKSGQELASPQIQLSSSAASSPGAFPTTLSMAVHSTSNPFIQGPGRAHKTLVSTSMPRSNSVTSTGASNSSSKFSIQPFKQREPRRRPRRSLGGTPSVMQAEMVSSASRRKVSLSSIPRVKPWMVAPEDIDTLITHLKDKEGELGEVYHSDDEQPQADLDLPFAMPSSTDDLTSRGRRQSTTDSDLAFFMRMLKQPPELPSIGVLQRPRRTMSKDSIP